MGISRPVLQFTLHLARKADLSRLASLGRQSMHVPPDEFEEVTRRFGVQAVRGDHFSETFLHSIGAKEIRTFDVSSYEKATDIVDFNEPLPERYRGWATTYIDYGSIEHILDPRQVMLNVNHILAPGGTAAILTCCNGMPTHGFYQFSPEFFFNTLAEHNGFKDARVLLVERDGDEWREAEPVTRLGRRHRLPNKPLYIVATATKVHDVDRITAMQSFYSDITWSSPPKPKTFKPKWRRKFRVAMPGSERRRYHRDTKPFDPAA